MHTIARYAPILGAYDPARSHRVSLPIGKRTKPRYVFAMGNGQLGWTNEQRGTALVVMPVGRIDEGTADAFRENLVSAVETGPAALVIDLAGVEYMSSRGLRALTLAQRAAHGQDTTIILARASEAMREILAISRYDMVFKVTDTVEDAIAS